jgi:hypothetical protein
MAHQELVERLAMVYGDDGSISRIYATAQGEGADPSDEWAVLHAQDVLAHMNPDVLQSWKVRHDLRDS